jgi:segregation and condensation protein B
MNDQYVRNVIEAALLAAGRPLAATELVALFDERDGFDAAEVHTAIEILRSEYETRGLELVEVANGFRIQIRAAVAQPVSRLWQERPAKYSRALLETLALVAYRQPITRGEIEQIRGVAVNPNIIKTLLERSWIRVVGHRDVPGKPELLGTTRDFLDYFSLKKLDDLPIRCWRRMAVMATPMAMPITTSRRVSTSRRPLRRRTRTRREMQTRSTANKAWSRAVPPMICWDESTAATQGAWLP